jgi:hypothetical protein
LKILNDLPDLGPQLIETGGEPTVRGPVYG